MTRLRLAFAALLVLAAIGSVAPKVEASTCPLYQVCMRTFPEGTCLCTGFYCNGQFICGRPIH